MGKQTGRNRRAALMLRETFAENFRHVRQAKKLSQRQIIGVSQKTVSAAELASADLRLSTMVKLALATGVDVSTLLIMPVAAE